MEIRPANRDDLAAIASIHSDSWRDAYAGILPDHYLADQVQQDLQSHWNQQEILPQDVVLVAETNDGLAGFIAVWCRPSPFLDNLHISPPRRSTGIGATLMRAAACQLIELGHVSAYLWVFENNTGAIRFYKRLGAAIVNRKTKTFFGHDVPNVRMEWTDLSAIGERP